MTPTTPFPLAFRPTPDLRSGLERRAPSEGIDPADASSFAAWVGNLIAQALPDAMADLVHDTDPPPGPTP